MDKNNLRRLLSIGAVVVVVMVLYGYFKSVNKTDREQTSSSKTEVNETGVPSGEQLPAQYVVKEGDSLWTVSEKAYGSGYNWVDVYAANKSVIKNPDVLLEGSKITLPKAEKKELTYQVKKGNNLWGISEAFCGNGFAYTKIAAANQIKDANLIEPGKVLKIVCN